MNNFKKQAELVAVSAISFFLISSMTSCKKTIKEELAATYKLEGKKANKEIQTIISLKDFGAVGDGQTDNYAALKALADSCNKIKNNIVINIPAGTYYVSQVKRQTNKKTVKDILYKGCNSITINAKGAKISLNGRYYRRGDVFRANSLFSHTNAIVPFWFKNCKNITIKGLEINGNIQNARKENGVVEQGSALIRFLSCEDVLLENVYVHHAQTDGLVVTGVTGALCKNITMRNVVSSNNGRQGISIKGVVNGEFKNCSFDSSGVTGKYGYHLPASGIDIEPDSHGPMSGNLLFEDCNMRGSLKSQFIVTSPKYTSNITLRNCTITGPDVRARHGIIILAKNVVLDGCKINFKESNLNLGGHMGGTSVKVINCEIKSFLNGILAASAIDNDNIYIANNSLKFADNTMTTYFPFLRAKNLRFFDNKVYISSKAIKSKRAHSIVENAIISKGNKFYSDQTGIIPVVSYKNSKMLKD